MSELRTRQEVTTNSNSSNNISNDYRLEIEALTESCLQKDLIISELTEKNNVLTSKFKKLKVSHDSLQAFNKDLLDIEKCRNEKTARRSLFNTKGKKACFNSLNYIQLKILCYVLKFRKT